MFSRRSAILCLALLTGAKGTAWAQIKSNDAETVVRYGETQVVRYQVGASITPKRGAVRNVLATVAVPLTCPEQQVELIEEDVSEQVASHDYRLLQGGGAQQMMIKVPYLPNKTEAHAILTFEVRTRTILPPTDTSELTIPQKPSRELKRYLGKSPFIETNHSKLRKLLRQILAEAESTQTEDENAELTEAAEPKLLTDWHKAEAIYNYVQDTIEYVEGPDKSALATLRAGSGDCQNISALFVALCRTGKIPARIVWVHEHNYPEFCLADPAGKLHWFPCESSGTRAFGEMPLARVIMQKGDNFRVPERKKSLRYASDYLIGDPAAPGGGPPSYKFIRVQL